MAVETISEAMRTQRLMMEVCPFRLGQKVLVRQSDSKPWSSDWANEAYIITGMSWDYRKGDGSRINISIAGEEDIVHRNGDTDGFDVDDLEAI